MADQNKNLGVYGYCEGSYKKGNRLRSHSVCPVCTALFVREKTGIPLHKIGQGVFRRSRGWGWSRWIFLPVAVVVALCLVEVLIIILVHMATPDRSIIAAKKSELSSPAELGR